MITQNDIDILNFLHNRLVERYKENPNVDYLIKARDVIGYLQQELVSGIIASHEQALPIQLVRNSLDLRELERKLDEALGKETRETLTEWLKQQRQ